MRRYETIFIVDPDLSDEDRNSFVDQLKGLITKYEGILVEINEWGSKKLAYEIQKRTRGHYFYFNYCGTSILVDELERFCRIDDRSMKYMTVLLEKAVDGDAVKEEIAQKEADEKKAAEEKAEADAARKAEAEAKAAEESANAEKKTPEPPETVEAVETSEVTKEVKEPAQSSDNGEEA